MKRGVSDYNNIIIQPDEFHSIFSIHSLYRSHTIAHFFAHKSQYGPQLSEASGAIASPMTVCCEAEDSDEGYEMERKVVSDYSDLVA